MKSKSIQKKGAYALALMVVLTGLTVSCWKDEDEPSFNKKIVFEDKSVTPALVKAMPGVDLQIFTLISSDDRLPESQDFFFAGQPDGAGTMKDPDGEEYIMVNNHEIHFSVSRI